MTTNARSKESRSSGHKKPKRRPGHPGELAILQVEDALGGGKMIRAANGGDDEKTAKSAKGKPRRRNPATPKKAARKSANDVMLDAWEYTYKTRNRRLTNS